MKKVKMMFVPIASIERIKHINIADKKRLISLAEAILKFRVLQTPLQLISVGEGRDRTYKSAAQSEFATLATHMAASFDPSFRVVNAWIDVDFSEQNELLN